MSVDFRESVLNYVQAKSHPNDVHGVLNAIDEYGWKKQALMNIGDTKGKILDAALRSRQPKTVLELGTFLGYSSLRMASQLPEDTLIVTIELNSDSAATARRIHEHAGVANRIQIVLDRTDRAIPSLKKKFNVDSFDLIFIDHHKEAYLSDFQLLEKTGLIKCGTMIVADNILYPGAPDYVKYVRNNPHYTSTFHESTLEYDPSIRDGVEISTRR